ncbi:MAG: gamma-glutamyl-gamma-aminobutyrate hydrolase family protein [Deltaproteobacteria bacterium]|nr:gamma-glutamyl-gamma-aminobutyrate hydrolase family protein [Deltaproteobacteria bacterium]
MKKILVCQHVAHEILGTLNPLFKSHGFRIKYTNFNRDPEAKPDLDGYHGLLILGGPMNVDETEKHPHLVHEVELIQKAIESGLPVLGICLGAQLIAKALGSKVTRHHTKEIGWYDLHLTDAGRGDPVLKNFSSTEKMFQWHGDTFDLPKGAIHLASSEICKHQAFRYGDNVYGLQFHMEVDEPMIHRWLKIAANKKEIEETFGAIQLDKILEETPQYIDRLKSLSHLSFGSFVEILGAPKKFKRLTSR